MSQYIESLKKELQENAEAYKGKTAKEIAEILNNPVVTEVPIELVAEPIQIEPTTRTIIEDAPVLKIINGIPEAPNMVSEKDVLEALQ